ncbi:hypothetical protein [Salinimicrobium flavum]|uniref:Uncharacterized protein n=1 Tax=Salinimicrobium flavum TaxID=1737065 RepID=A0ABW5IZW1_9FLAO
MKKIFPILILLLAGFLIYNSKRSYYKNKTDFYEKNLNGIINQIKEGRGTKVYINESDFFYLEQLENKSLKVGDSISKKNSDLFVFEKNKNNGFSYLTTINVKKPKDNYYEFFFGI